MSDDEAIRLGYMSWDDYERGAHVYDGPDYVREEIEAMNGDDDEAIRLLVEFAEGVHYELQTFRRSCEGGTA